MFLATIIEVGDTIMACLLYFVTMLARQSSPEVLDKMALKHTIIINNHFSLTFFGCVLFSC